MILSGFLNARSAKYPLGYRCLLTQREFLVTNEYNGLRADKFMRLQLQDIPYSLLQKTFRKKLFKSSLGKAISPKDIIEEGDKIIVPAFLVNKPSKVSLQKIASFAKALIIIKQFTSYFIRTKGGSLQTIRNFSLKIANQVHS